jgi:hypothetical protein
MHNCRQGAGDKGVILCVDPGPARRLMRGGRKRWLTDLADLPLKAGHLLVMQGKALWVVVLYYLEERAEF